MLFFSCILRLAEYFMEDSDWGWEEGGRCCEICLMFKAHASNLILISENINEIVTFASFLGGGGVKCKYLILWSSRKSMSVLKTTTAKKTKQKKKETVKHNQNKALIATHNFPLLMKTTTTKD